MDSDYGAQNGGNRAEDSSLVPVTYYPLPTQKHLARMKQRMAGKPYAAYFNSSPLHVRREVLGAIQHPLSDPADEVLPLSEARELLKPGYHPAENGWYSFPDGTGYVASKTEFQNCSGEMIDWWFWWHSVEAERYALWYPYNHCSVQSTYARCTTSIFTAQSKKDKVTGSLMPILERDDLPDRLRWLGSVHTVDEFIGPKRIKVRIEFKEPEYFGLGSWEDLQEAGYEAAACGILWADWAPIQAGEMIHLWRRKENGLELRSRYYLLHNISLDILGWKLPLNGIASRLGVKYFIGGASLAYEQFLHDQTEFTNLASILPGLYREFGKKKGQGVPTI